MGCVFDSHGTWPFSKTSGGPGLPTINLLYKKLKVSQATLLLASRNLVIQQVDKRMAEKENQLPQPEFRPMKHSQEIMANDPGASKWSLLKKASPS